MDKILRELNLGTLVDRFDAEKIEPDNVISASDSELTRLGVSTTLLPTVYRLFRGCAMNRVEFQILTNR